VATVLRNASMSVLDEHEASCLLHVATGSLEPAAAPRVLCSSGSLKSQPQASAAEPARASSAVALPLSSAASCYFVPFLSDEGSRAPGRFLLIISLESEQNYRRDDADPGSNASVCCLSPARPSARHDRIRILSPPSCICSGI
jgi:hypothetical protein